jgi:hypothetical protein
MRIEAAEQVAAEVFEGLNVFHHGRIRLCIGEALFI